ncbi:MAG: hypothetical protein OEV35_08225, partial [Gallionellaceae bacterium]|nr:hypothetical protein [Gallionellaceae bacterium]
MMRLGITSRLWLVLLLMAALPLIALQQALDEYFSQSMRRAIIGHLQATTSIKMSQIDSQMEHLQKSASVLAQLAETRSLLKELEARGKGRLLRQRMQQFVDMTESVAASPEGFYDFLLVAPSGDVVLTLKREQELGTNLYTGPYSQTLLGKAVRESQLFMREVFSGIELYLPSQKLAAFFVIPVMEGKRQLGSLAVQLTQDTLHKLTSDYSGLGETGEVVIAQLAGSDAVIVAPLRTSKERLPLKVEKGSGVALFDA